MSTTVIDAFLVTLGLDGRAFQAGVRATVRGQREIRDASDRTADAERRNDQRREAANKRGVDGYRRMRNEVLALAAIFTAGVGIKDFISNTINSAVNLGYLAQNLGSSTERIKAFQLASERAGGSQEGLADQLRESVDAIAELNTGGGPNAGMQAFFRWGGSSKDLKDGNTYLLARSKIIQEMFAVDPGRAALIAKQMGISEDQFNFIKLGPDAIEDLIKAQEKNAAVSAKNAAEALKLRNQLLDLRDSLQATATRVILQLAPAFERLFARLEVGAQWIAAHKDDIADWVDSSVTAVRDFVQWADKAAESVGGWKNVLIGLVALKVTGFALSLVSMGAMIVTALGPATLALTAFVAAYAAVRELNTRTGGKIDMAVGKVLEYFGDKGATHEAAKLKPHAATPPPDAKGAPPRPPVITPDAKGAQERLSALETQYGLPRGLLDTVWKTESQRGNPKWMESPAGAQGHFGFMPPTAKEYGLKNPNDFNESSDAAARKMRDLLKQYGGDLEKATSAYNWGQGNLAKKGMAGRPEETRDYAAKMLAGVQAANVAPPGRASGGDNSTTVQVDNININTQATDAAGIAREIKPAVAKYSFSSNANTGMTP